MLSLHGVSLTLPDGKLLLDNISFTLAANQKAALIGHNGAGKSTLFQIITGEVQAQGTVVVQDTPYYLPQLFGQFDHYTIGQALRVESKLNALRKTLHGMGSEQDITIIDDDWDLEERVVEALDYWKLEAYHLSEVLGNLSGGERTKVFLAGISIHRPRLILLDEPTNHLDLESRKLLYEFVTHSTKSMLITSHDRTLLNLLDPMIELSRKGVAIYGGSYDFYVQQRQMTFDALTNDIKEKEKALRKARDKERETLQRQQKLNNRGKSKQEKAGLPTIVQHAFKNAAERSTAKIKGVHASKINGLANALTLLRGEISDPSKMKLQLNDARLHHGKMLFEAEGINYRYDTHHVWPADLSVRIHSGERIAIAGKNGSGKTTLIKIILGLLKPSHGIARSSGFTSLYIDQDYSLIDNSLTVSQQVQAFNQHHLEFHELNIRLTRFLFPKEFWDRPCRLLSGGERMRLTLCCLHIADHSPDIIVLDEPTNNLDIQSVEILTAAIHGYCGTLLIISHDTYFLQSINTQRTIDIR